MRPIEAQLKAIKWDAGVPMVIGEVARCYLDLPIFVGDKTYLDFLPEENIILEECCETGNKFYTGVISVLDFRQYISEGSSQSRLLKWYSDIYLFSDYIFFEEKFDDLPF